MHFFFHLGFSFQSCYLAVLTTFILDLLEQPGIYLAKSSQLLAPELLASIYFICGHLCMERKVVDLDHFLY